MSVTRRTNTIRELVPLFFVESIESSVEFYRDRLGFEVALTWEPEGKLGWCRLERDGSAVMLQQVCEEDGPAEDRGRGIGFYFICDDADAIHAELTERGLNLAQPHVAFYGMKQVFVTDPDGYRLCFESQVEPA
jgi:uncharacterized glyoxalase superfamily protein PhnB